MITEDAYTDRLSDYLDGEDLSARDRAEIDAHLETCSRCQTTLAELKEVAARAASLPDRRTIAVARSRYNVTVASAMGSPVVHSTIRP